MKARGDDFGRLGIGVTLFHCDPDWVRWWTWLLVGGFRPDDYLLMSQDIPHSVPIPLAHNAIVREFLKVPGLDTLLIIEDDHVGDQDIIERLRTKPENLGYDIVCASYPTRRGKPPSAIGMVFDMVEPNTYGEVGCLVEPLKVARTGTQTVGCAALGCVLIRRWVLQAMADRALEQGAPDIDGVFWFDWVGRNSQDIQFYWKARDLGARVGVDRDNTVGHVGRYTYTMQEFYEYWEKYKTEGNNNG
jgi:hypothetical protein